jgi:peptidyl-prolyl cis-trans isomerase D
MQIIFIITIIGFFAAIFIGFGSYLFGSQPSVDTILKINGTKVPSKLYNTLYANALLQIQNSSSATVTQEQATQLKTRTVEALIQDEIFYQQALKYKIMISDDELRNNIINSPMFRENNAFNQRLYNMFLSNINMTPKEYEDFMRKQIIVQKFKNFLISSVKITNSEFSLISQLNPNLDVNTYAQYKVNRILNEWYVNILKTSKVNVNEELLK